MGDFFLEIIIMAFEFNFFENIETSLIGNVDMFFGKCMSLVVYITPLVTTGLGIYIILQAYHYYKMGLDESILDISRRMVGWILIAMLALNAGNYEKMAKMVYKFPDEIASAVNGTEFKSNVFDASRKTADEAIDAIGKKSLKTFKGLKNIGKSLVFEFQLWLSKIFAGLLLLFVFGYYLIAKISLLMVLMVGPIFISCLFFPTLRQWGMQWINQIMNLTICIVLYIVLAMIQKSFFDTHLINFVNLIEDNTAVMTNPVLLLSGTATMCCIFFLSTVIFILVSMRVPSIASAITGGATLESGIGSAMRFANTYLKGINLPSRKGKVSNGG